MGLVENLNDLLVLGIGLLIIIIIGNWKYLDRKFGVGRLLRPKEHLDNKSPLLLAYYTAGNDIIKVRSGELDTISYKAFMTIPGAFDDRGSIMDGWAVIFAIELDFNTQAHIIGLGKEAHLERLQLTSYFSSYQMEPVVLEGNFHEYFDLFAANGQQSQVRYLFDPKAMQTYMDVCAYNFWEIVGDEMYVVIGRNHKNYSPVIKHAKQFTDEIRPALLRTMPGEEPVYHEPAYGEYRGPALKCPLCNTDLNQMRNTHICPMGHGVLMHGRDLIAIRKQKFTIQLPAQQIIEHGDLICPNCKGTMKVTPYQGSKTIIDVCMKCVYRWIDAHEFAAVCNIKSVPPNKLLSKEPTHD